MSNSNHDPKNKECLLNHLDTICFPSGNVRPVLHIDRDMNGKKFVCPYSVCTCPEQNMEEKKCMCGEHQLGYFIISERIGETIHSRESPCWVREKEDHTKCRKLGASDLCVCCPCGCDTPMDAPNYAELHGAPTEQKEEWENAFQYMWEDSYTPKWRHPADCVREFIRTQLALAEKRGRDAQQKEDYEVAKAQQEKAFKSGAEMGEERGRRETITEFVEWANKYNIFTPTCGHTGDEEKGYQKGITAGEKLFQTNLLAYTDSLKSNLTQK